MFMLALLGAVLTFVSQRQVGAVKSYHGGSMGTTIVLMGQSYWGYVFSLVTGRGLSPVHGIPPINWPMGLGFYATALATALLLWFKKKWFLLWTMVAFFLFLLPVSNLIPIAVLRADRYLYIPIIFFFLALLSLFDCAWRKGTPQRPRLGIWLFGTLLFLSYAPATAQYLPVYRDAQSLWSCVAKNPSLRGKAFYNLGVVEERQGRIIQAMAYYERARRTNGHCRAVNNLGSIVFDSGFHEKAHDFFLEAQAKCPNDPGILYNLGLSFLVKNDAEQARHCFQKVIAHGQHHPELVTEAEEKLEQIRESSGQQK
jgi:tetratricopeptide (TPR) repeat protein